MDALRANLRRLLLFHHASAREASLAIGVSENTVSSWLTGKHRPAMDALVKIGDLYLVDARELTGNPVDLVGTIGDRERFVAAEANIRKAVAHNLGMMRYRLANPARYVASGEFTPKQAAALEARIAELEGLLADLRERDPAPEGVAELR